MWCRPPPLPDLKALWGAWCADQGWYPEPAQLDVLERIQPVAQAWCASPRWGLFRPRTFAGIYLWGPPGRGKTLLADCLYRAFPLPARRVHFADFMVELHAAPQPLKKALNSLLQKTRLLVLDEFQVTHIADAMILKQLFEILTGTGRVFCVTSNTAPDELYKNGLNRERFLPFVHWILSRAFVCQLQGERDLRQSTENTPPSHPRAPSGDDVFRHLTGESPRSGVCTLWTQTLPFQGQTRDVILTRFHDLCERPLGASDYRVLAQTCSVLIVQDIPAQPASDALVRWMVLVDLWYDRGHTLVWPPGAFENSPGMVPPPGWERTASRMAQMHRKVHSTDATPFKRV